MLLDEGSHRTFITAKLANALQLQVSGREMLALATFSAERPGTRTLEKAEISVKIQDGYVDLHVLIIPSIAPPIKNHDYNELKSFDHLKHIDLAPCPRTEELEIDLLVGADYYWQFVGDQVIKGDSGPTAVSSNLGGYLLSGPTVNQFLSSITLVSSILADEPPSSIDMKQYWDLESLGVTTEELTTTEPFDTKSYSDTIEYKDGHYVASFPWKKDHDPLPTNYAKTIARTRAMVKKLSADDRLLYDKIIMEQLERNFIEVVPTHNSEIGHYLPHYAVAKESSSTPLRIVYCCNSKSKTTPSLNDCLEQGPLLLQDLNGILLRFRARDVAFTADIEKAFLNIELHPDDREYTKFLWLSDPTNPNSDFVGFRFRTVLFGATSSPFILNLVIQKHLQQHEHVPIAHDIANNIYVDNLLSGCAPDEALSYYHTARRLLREAGFNLRAWASNSPILQEQITRDGGAGPDENVNILGLRWRPTEDTVSCRPLPGISDTETLSKRDILSSVSKLYDVFGLLSPVHVPLKVIFQELHVAQLKWNDQVPADVITKWRTCYNELRDASLTITWTRAIPGLQPTTPVKLQVFCDSSVKAYGACIYIVTHTGASTLIMAKNRLAPLNPPQTLPRLELMGVLVGTKLLNFIRKNLRNCVLVGETILWSDSQIVLSWIKSDKKLPRFVTNRIAQIKQANIDQYRYCPTKDNPADLLTRGITCRHLRDSQLWWHGPEWLHGNWPESQHTVLLTNNEPETNEQNSASDEENNVSEDENDDQHPNLAHDEDHADVDIDISSIINIERFSSLSKLLRCTATVLRFVDKLRHRTQTTEPLDTVELQKAKVLWIKSVQEQTFSRERSYLKQQCQRIGPKVKQLKLFMDNTGIIRKGGRMENAQYLSFDCKYPILLPQKHYFSYLVVHRAHANVMHQGPKATLANIRQTWWITQIHSVVKSFVRKCTTCKKVAGRPYRQPITPPLQKWRVNETPPFAVTGVDYTGEVWVRDSNGPRKVYICLFTCAVTRGIHLELVHDLSCQEYLLAFRRFAARRSLPSKMVSDNATCFTAAGHELRKLFTSDELKNTMANQGVEWHFIPKRAPWYGGFWERLIGMVKNAMRKTLGHATITETELQTLLTEIEAVINDRPITQVSTTADGPPMPLTPSHLISGRLLTTLPYPTPDLDDPEWRIDENSAILDRHKKLGQIMEHYWTRFSSEYLPALRDKHTWNKGTGLVENKIKVNDVVLVHSDTKKRPLWKMAVVQKLITGNDGLVRAAEIRTRTGHTNRPITKLYPLELSADYDDRMDKTEHENDGDGEQPELDQNVEDEHARDTFRGRPKRRAAIDAAAKIRRSAKNRDSSESEELSSDG